MPRSENGNWMYEYPAPQGQGDSLRRAFDQLRHDVEAYLFDERYPGYGNPAFLSWALEAASMRSNSSGTLSDKNYTWNPAIAGEHAIPQSDGKVYDRGVRYPQAAFDHPGIDTRANAPGEKELLGLGDKDVDLTHHNASEVSGEAVVRNTDSKPADDKRSPEGR